MRIFRLHVRPKGGKNDPRLSVELCLKKNIAGMGWGVGSDIESWEDYCSSPNISDWYSKVPSSVRYLHDQLSLNDAIWIRDLDGCYYLGKVCHTWKYSNNPDHIDADIVNYVGVEKWIQVPVDNVPGALIASFRPSRVLQAANAASIEVLTKHFLGIDVNLDRTTFFNALDSEDIEDILFIFLQVEGYTIIPSSRKADTMSYEFFAIKDGKTAVVQVKTGWAHLDASAYKKFDEAFLYQENNHIQNLEATTNCTVVSKEQLWTIVEEFYAHLSGRVKTMKALVK